MPCEILPSPGKLMECASHLIIQNFMSRITGCPVVESFNTT